MAQNRLRIAISGPAGAGKTTLAKALGDELSVPVLEEGLVDLYNAQMSYRRLASAPDATSDEQRRAMSEWMRTYFDWCDARSRAYAQCPCFIADRWELDLFAYWLYAFVQHDTWDGTRRLQEIFLRRASEFDLLVLLPMGDFAVGERNESGLKRQTSRNRSLLAQASFSGLLSMVPESITKYAPRVVESQEKRVADIIQIAETLRS